MKFTLAALAAITLGQAHAYAPACPPAQTVTVTQTVEPAPSYVPRGNDGNYGPGKHHPGGPHKGKPWGSHPPAATHTVIVGGKDAAGAPVLKFNPEVVYAAVGDSVVYDFRANNHSLTESTFEVPCEAKPAGGFKSGFLDNEDDVPGAQLFTVHVEDELPHWAYCGQKVPVNHCQKGMVHAINPPRVGDRTFEAFKKIATGDYSSPPIVPPHSPLPPYTLPNATYPGYPGPTDYPTAPYPTVPYPTAPYPTAQYPTTGVDTEVPSETVGDAHPSSSAVYSSVSADYPTSSSTSDDTYSILPVHY